MKVRRPRCAVYYGVVIQAGQGGFKRRIHELAANARVPCSDVMSENAVFSTLVEARGLDYVHAEDAKGVGLYLLSVQGHATRVYEHKHARLLDDLQDPVDAEVAKLVALIEDLGDYVPVEDRTPAWRAYVWTC